MYPLPIVDDNVHYNYRGAEMICRKLIEQMAKNVHEVWAQSRMEQGWTYGEKRDDTLKTHPCLVAYEDLPEIEKAYDRDTALGTLKLISKLGFKISK